MARLPVAVIGATGVVGQRIITMLADHPEFEIRELASSGRTAGKPYAEAAVWRQSTPIPERVRALRLKEGGTALSTPLIFSSMPTGVAGPIEQRYAAAGHTVISNSGSHRMDAHVPLVIPEVNADHLALVRRQGTPGAIVTNCNCSAMFLTLALAPLHKAFGVEAVHVTTMQAVSGAGYPGVASLDILGNVFPLPGEEEKMERETQKILGTLDGDTVVPAMFPVSAHCQRVPVIDGHTEAVSVKLAQEATPEDVRTVLADFRGMPQEQQLHSAPPRPIIVFTQPDRPQPLLDVTLESGMVAAVGRVRSCPILSIKMLVLGHNLVRGAAAAAVLNAEAMVSLGLLAP